MFSIQVPGKRKLESRSILVTWSSAITWYSDILHTRDVTLRHGIKALVCPVSRDPADSSLSADAMFCSLCQSSRRIYNQRIKINS